MPDNHFGNLSKRMQYFRREYLIQGDMNIKKYKVLILNRTTFVRQ
jgi:hypothetical protein